MAERHQRQRPGRCHRSHHRRLPCRQIRPQVHLHLQPAGLYVGRAHRHALYKLPDAPVRFPHHGHLGRRRRASLVDIYLRELRGQQPRTQYLHLADVVGLRPYDHPAVRDVVCPWRLSLWFCRITGSCRNRSRCRPGCRGSFLLARCLLDTVRRGLHSLDTAAPVGGE